MSNSVNLLYGVCEKIPTKSLGEAFFECLKRKDGQDIAMVDAHTKAYVTYAELFKNSINVANDFKRSGIGKNDIIALVSENNLDYVVPVLAALYVGAVIQPANPDWNQRELKHAFEICKPKWVICTITAFTAINQIRADSNYIERVILFGSKRNGEKSFSDFLETNNSNIESFQPDVLNSEEQLAFIFSSSGTTGLPKAVMLTHQNMALTINYWRDDRFGNYQEGDTTVIPMPLFHLFGMTMLLTSLIASVKYIMISKFNPELYLRCIQDYQVNKIACPPPLIVFLAKSPLVDAFDLSTLKEIISASASLRPDTEKLVQQKLNVTLRQTFAVTETSGACTMVPRNCLKPGSSGIVLPNFVAKVIEPDTGRLLGPNQTGELCFKGPLLTKGYLENEKATMAAFDDDGFYLTGDVGYYDDEGFFYIVDRLKDLIKYKGFQVAPAELEGILLSHPAVKDAAVIGIPDERAGELPLAYVVKQPNTDVTEKELIDFIAEHVYAGKRLYGGVKFIDEIPKNPTGKILRRLLKEMTINTNL